MKKIIILLFILVSCNQSKKDDSKDCNSKTTLQLNWTNDPTFTGEYIALNKFWSVDKLDVTINQGGIGIDPIATVVTKKSDFAVVGADKALMAIADGKPIKIISIDLQRNPVGWIVRPSAKVNNFSDLNNRKDLILGDKSGTEVTSILNIVLNRKKVNIEPKSVSFDFSYFLNNENSVYPVYLNEEPVRARILNKINVVELDPAEEVNGGIKLYGNVIITHSDLLVSCPNKVDAFVEGISKGWEFAKANPKEAVKIVNEYVKMDENYVKEVIERTVKYATELYGKEVPAGHMEFTAWENSMNTLIEAKLISKPIDLNKVIYIKK